MRCDRCEPFSRPAACLASVMSIGAALRSTLKIAASVTFSPCTTSWRGVTVENRTPDAMREAGFVHMRVSTSTDSYTEPAAIREWSSAYTEAMLQSNFVDRVLVHGVATRSDLEGIAAAWRAWGNDPHAFICLSQTEVVAWK